MNAGWKSSEFAKSSGTAAALLYVAADHASPAAVRVAAIAGAVAVAAVYCCCRTLAKAGGPVALVAGLLSQWSTSLATRRAGTAPSTPPPSPK